MNGEKNTGQKYSGQNYTASEMMAVMTSKEFQDSEIAFVGIGLPLIAGMLAKRTHAPGMTIVYESGCIGPEKLRVDFNVGDSSAADRALCLTSEWHVFGDLQGGFFDVGVLGGAQIDRFGNLNTTVIFGEGGYAHPAVRLPGSGGGNDISSSIGRVVIMMRLERHRFVHRVDFITSPGYLDGGPDGRRKAGLLGHGPVAVVTDKCIFHFDAETREMVLAALYPGVTVDEVRASVQWDLRVAGSLKSLPAPTAEELAALRSADPAGLILGGSASRKNLSGIQEYADLIIRSAGMV